MNNRATFANSVLKHLYNTYNGEMDNAEFLQELKQMVKWFEEYVRNIYEVFDEIPLILYYEYLNVRDVNDIYYKEFEDMDKESVLSILKDRCKTFYSK